MPLHYVLIVFELFVMVLAISLHDAAQAWAANRLGDPTARMLGRVSMNPARHFDAFGMVISPFLSLFIFSNFLPYGWGKQVPMTYRNFPSRSGEVRAVLAGPGAQFLAAVLALVILIVLKHALPAANESLLAVMLLAQGVPMEGLDSLPGIFPLLLLLYLSIMMNLLLCIFNLLPMPFLDGGKILTYFLPYNAARAFEQYSFYFMIAFFVIGGRLVGIVFTPLLVFFSVLLGKL